MLATFGYIDFPPGTWQFLVCDQSNFLQFKSNHFLLVYLEALPSPSIYIILPWDACHNAHIVKFHTVQKVLHLASQMCFSIRTNALLPAVGRYLSNHDEFSQCRRWPNIKLELAECLVICGYVWCTRCEPGNPWTDRVSPRRMNHIWCRLT